MSNINVTVNVTLYIIPKVLRCKLYIYSLEVTWDSVVLFSL